MEETILSLEKSAMERWRRGDPMGWAEISAEDVIYIDPGLTKPIAGLEGYKTFLKQIEGTIFYQGSEFIEPRVAFYGNAAILTYNYQSTDTLPAKPTTDRNLWNTTEVYFKLAGKWKIAHSHWSYVNHRLPEKVEIPLPVEIAPQQFDGVLREVMKLESAAMERWRKGDPWGFTDLYAPEVTYFDSGTPWRLNGLDAMKAEYALREGNIHYDVMEFLDPRVLVRDNVAVLSYRFLSTLLNPDGSILSRMPWNCSEVYVKSGNRWQIVHNHWSLIKGERVS
jgi:ketosteroid isomerase-like protein